MYKCSKRQQAVLVYAQQAVFSSSMQCSKQHKVAASNAAKADVVTARSVASSGNTSSYAYLQQVAATKTLAVA